MARASVSDAPETPPSGGHFYLTAIINKMKKIKNGRKSGVKNMFSFYVHYNIAGCFWLDRNHVVNPTEVNVHKLIYLLIIYNHF